VVGGILDLPGGSLQEKSDYVCSEADSLRTILVGEPRGHAAMHAVIPLPPSNPEADISILILSGLGSQGMCGHALIGTVTVLLEAGIIEATEPMTKLTVETLSGLVAAEAEVSDGRVRSVRFRNVPAMVLALDVVVDVPELGPVAADIVYSGLWYGIVDVREVGLDIVPDNVAALMALGARIRLALDRWLRDAGPAGSPDSIPSLLFVSSDDGGRARGRNLATSTALGFDRSPCGTGSCARMAQLHARGKLGLHEVFVHESVLGTTFEGILETEVSVGGRPAVVPAISGSAFITGFNQLVVDPDDELGDGFLISPVARLLREGGV
jgi:proline racemase